jgi:DNA-binding transcriptional ArsR family regulator
MNDDSFNLLLDFFKVLADETRLRIIGLLAVEKQCSVGTLAEHLQLKSPTISHHLSKLREIGLVNMRMDGTIHYYTLNTDALRTIGERVLQPEQLVQTASSAAQMPNLRGIIEGERIVQIPASYKKKLIVLRWLADRFERDRRYAEREVNQIIRQHHEDTATLRRELIANRFMQRETGTYWRLPQDQTEAHITTLLESKPLRAREE